MYDLVVSPHKKAKLFSRLMASLLQGYIEDEYIDLMVMELYMICVKHLYIL